MIAPIPEFASRLAFLGSPSIAVPALHALVAADFEVVHVVTRIDKRRGRGSDLVPTPVKAAAQSLNLSVSHHVDDLLAIEPPIDLAVVVAFGQIIKPPVLERIPMINIHFSLLPRWRGAAPVERALLAGDHFTGTCLMQVAEGLDAGDVYDTVEVPIGESTTAAALRDRLAVLGAEQLVRCLQHGLRDPKPQQGAPTYAAKLLADEFRIDWTQPAVTIDRLIRVGGAWTTFRGKRLKIHAAHLADGDLIFDSVQPEGKPVMDYASWARGARPTPEEFRNA